MTKRVRYGLDFIPIVLLFLYTSYSVITRLSNGYVFQPQHYLGIAFLLLDLIILIRHHQTGLLLFGLILLIGLFNFVSFDAGLITFAVHFKFDVSLRFNAIMLLFMILHLSLSFRYYVGILTRQYWKNLLDDFNTDESNAPFIEKLD